MRHALPLLLLLAAPRLAAQDIPIGPRLMRVLSSSNGIVLSVDSLTVVRTADSTFLVNTIYDFPPDSTHGRPVTHMEESQEMDCGGTRLRGRHTVWGDPEHPFSWMYSTVTPSPTWQPVADDELPIFQAVCTWLLGSFAASLPLDRSADDLASLDQQPELTNRGEVARALSRAYPADLHRQHVGGTVIVRFQITTEGRADTATARVVRATRREFGLAALEVVSRMRFRPGKNHGEPVAVWVYLPVAFDN